MRRRRLVNYIKAQISNLVLYWMETLTIHTYLNITSICFLLGLIEDHEFSLKFRHVLFIDNFIGKRLIRHQRSQALNLRISARIVQTF